MYVCMGMLTCVFVWGGAGGREGSGPVGQYEKGGGSPVSGLSEKDRRLWREGESGVVGPREQSKCGGRGEAPVKIWGRKGLGKNGTLSPGIVPQGAGVQAGSGSVSKTTSSGVPGGTSCVLGLGMA